MPRSSFMASSLEPPSSSIPNTHCEPKVFSDSVATTVSPMPSAIPFATSMTFSPASTVTGAEKESSWSSCNRPSKYAVPVEKPPSTSLDGMETSHVPRHTLSRDPSSHSASR